MNNFFVYVKNANSKKFERIPGTPVFPFNYGQLLDERLNEAYVTIYHSPIKEYKPTTEIRIDMRETDKITSQYYIVASDNAYEFPVGSGKYKHKLYLIERTKLLEGIMCQSITFTNPKSNLYTSAQHYAPVTFTRETSIGFNQGINTTAQPFPDVYKTPLSSKENHSFLSLEGMASVLISYLEKNTIMSNLYIVPNHVNNANNYQRTYSQIDITRPGLETLTITSLSETPSFSSTNNATIQYTIVLRTRNDASSVWFYRFYWDFTFVENRYPLKPWTVKDCIDRVLELAEPLYLGEEPRYRLNDLQAATFDKIQAPEFTMTQCNLREQLKVIGGYIHAEPRLDENDVIHFDPFDSDEAASENAPYVYNGVSHHINQYCTQIDTSASNIVNALDYAQGVIAAPNSSNFRTIRTDSVNARVVESNGFISTQFPIHEIVKVECGIYDKSSDAYWLLPVDITPYVFESTSYFSNLSSYSGGYPKAKSFAIYYTIGEKNLQGLFYKEPSAWDPSFQYYAIVNILSAASGENKDTIRDYLGEDGAYVGNLCFRVSYIPIYNTRFTHGKPYVNDQEIEYARPYNQSENLIETRYYGENIKGVAARLGNVEQERTYIFNKETYNLERAPKIGQTIDGFAVSAVSVSFMPNYVKCTVALSKDFNRISQYVGISSNKRVYEVSERQAYARNVLLKEYCVVGKKQEYKRGIFRNNLGILSIFKNLSAKPITAASAYGLTGSMDPNAAVLLPVVSSAFGNTMTFSWSYKDNYSAGEKVSLAESGQTEGYWQNDVPYCDYYGRIKYYQFNLLMGSVYGDGKQNAMNLPQRDYIEVSSSDGYISTQGYLEEGKPYIMQKDSREVINMNFALEFKSNLSSLIIGSAMAANCSLVRDKKGMGDKFTPKLYVLSRKVGKFQMRITDLPENGQELTTGNDDGKIYIEIPKKFEDVTAWAICLPQTTEQKIYDKDGSPETVDETNGGDILIACNDPAKFWAEAAEVGAGDEESRLIYLNLARNIYN